MFSEDKKKIDHGFRVRILIYINIFPFRLLVPPREKANRGTTGSKQAGFRALGSALAWLEFRGRFLGNTQWRWTAKAPSPGCFQSPITDTLQSNVMFLVLDRALLIKG